MTTAQKLILGAIIITAIVAVIYYDVNKNYGKIETTSNVENTVDDVFNQYTKNSTNNNETNVSNNVENENNSVQTVEVTGTDEEKAIALSKNKWGASDDTVSFNIANQEGKTYYVSVNNKETTEVLAWYKVNVENGEVSDY